MIPHKLALLSAEILSMYCNEHWNKGECQKCIFQKGKNLRSCKLQLFLGFSGKELQETTVIDVKARCERLSNEQAENS